MEKKQNIIEMNESELESEFESEQVICQEQKIVHLQIPVIPISHIIINLFAAQKFLTSFYKARENIMTQAKEGRIGYYTFTYPEIGWTQYDHRSIAALDKLASMKSISELTSIYLNQNVMPTQRLHSIAAILLQCQEEIMKLFDGAERARNNRHKQQHTVTVFFQNPFRSVFYSDKTMAILNGKEIIMLQDIGHKLKFKPFIPFITKLNDPQSNDL